MKWLICLSILVSGGHAIAQPLPVPPMVRSGVYSSSLQNALQIEANQAALSNVKGFAAALYGEKRFLLQELSQYHLAVAQPTGNGAFGVQLIYAGDINYHTSKLGLAYGRMLSKKAAVGVQFNYVSQQTRGYNRAAQVSVEGGFVFHFSDAFHGGIQLCNPVGMTFSKGDRKAPAVYTAGITYQPSTQVDITAELIKIQNIPVAVQTCFTYRFASTLWAKTGINSSTGAFFIAAGVQLHDFSVEFSGSLQPPLGLSPGLFVRYNRMDK